MPSRYEPCGLGQLIALRYGTVPIVRRTGGLADTVRSSTRRRRTGTGFLFDAFTVDALLEAVRRAGRRLPAARAVDARSSGTPWPRTSRGTPRPASTSTLYGKALRRAERRQTRRTA